MEKVIQQTDCDAFSWKLAAIEKKYIPCKLQLEKCGYRFYEEIHREYCQVIKKINRRNYSKIVKVSSSNFPVMNYGTYLRTVSIDSYLSDFFYNHQNIPTQVINLGCGSDLRMISLLSIYNKMVYIDIDFKESVTLKKNVLEGSDRFCDFFNIVRRENNDTCLVTDRYKLFPCDLKNIDDVRDILSKHTSPCVPTIIITECVLCYIPKVECESLIKVVSEFYDHGQWLSYDPIGGSNSNDRFGSIMQSNLRASRQLDMPTLMLYNSKEKYSSRFGNNTKIQTLWEYYVNEVTLEEKCRLKTLQFLDEIEELEIILSHYILLISNW